MNKAFNPNPTPKVSVVMPVYNADTTVAEAVQSVLTQTFNDFEFLIMNDGSTDESLNVLAHYKDPRIQVHSFSSNQGLIHALNRGLMLSKGTYVARMDADDICHPNRFARQVQFMDQHPEIGVCGTWSRTFGKRKKRVWTFPPDHESIRGLLLFQSPLIHPTVFIRTQIQKEFSLDYRLENAEDYECWVRASKHTRLGNVPEVLLDFRVHKNSFTSTRTSEQHRKALSEIFQSQLQHLFPETETLPLDLHYAVAQRTRRMRPEQLLQAGEWLMQLRRQNEVHRLYPSKILHPILSRFYLEILSKSGASFSFIKRAMNVPIAREVGTMERFKVYFATLIHAFK